MLYKKQKSSAVGWYTFLKGEHHVALQWPASWVNICCHVSHGSLEAVLVQEQAQACRHLQACVVQ